MCIPVSVFRDETSMPIKFHNAPENVKVLMIPIMRFAIVIVKNSNATEGEHVWSQDTGSYCMEYTNRHINMGIGYTHSLNVAIMH